MRRTRVALIVDLVWLAALAAGVGAVAAFGPGWLGLGTCLIAAVAAIGLSLAFAARAEKTVQRKLAQLGQAVGAASGRDLHDGVSVEAIVANLAGRLERATQFKAAFSGLSQPALVVGADGEILGVSRGLTALEPRAVEGARLDVLLGDSYRAAGFAEEELVSLAGTRHTARHRTAGAGRSVVEFVPAGAYIAAMLTLDDRWLVAVGETPAAIRGTVGLAGPYDFLPLRSDALRAIFGPEDRWPATQPINFVNGKAPPMLLLTGDDDEVVDPGNSRRLADRVTAAGGRATVKTYPAIGHETVVGALAAPLRFLAPVRDDATAFMEGAGGS